MAENVEETAGLAEAKAEDTSEAGEAPKGESGGGDKAEEADETNSEETEKATAAEEAANKTEAADEADSGDAVEAVGEETANDVEATKEDDAGVTRKKRNINRQNDPPRESKRARKSADSFAPENFNDTQHKVTIIKGRGSRLGDIPNAKESIESYSNNSDDLAMAHKLLFNIRGKPGKDDMKFRKGQLLDFSGYLTPLVQGENKDERADIDEKAETKMSVKAYKMNVPALKRMCDVFDVDCSSQGKITKDELIDRLLNFLGAPDVKLTNASKETNRKVKANSPKQSRDEEEAEAEGSKEQEEITIPSDKALRKWVRAYITCFNMERATIKHALETVSDKFGVDLTRKKARIKELLTEEY